MNGGSATLFADGMVTGDGEGGEWISWSVDSHKETLKTTIYILREALKKLEIRGGLV